MDREILISLDLDGAADFCVDVRERPRDDRAQ